MTQPFGATPHRGTRLSQSVVVAPRSTGIGLPGTHECQQAPMSASWHQGMSAKPVPVLPRTSRMRWFQVATSEGWGMKRSPGALTRIQSSVHRHNLTPWPAVTRHGKRRGACKTRIGFWSCKAACSSHGWGHLTQWYQEAR